MHSWNFYDFVVFTMDSTQRNSLTIFINVMQNKKNKDSPTPKPRRVLVLDFFWIFWRHNVEVWLVSSATIFLIRCYVHYVQNVGSFSEEICVYDYVEIHIICALSVDVHCMEMTGSVLLNDTTNDWNWLHNCCIFHFANMFISANWLKWCSYQLVFGHILQPGCWVLIHEQSAVPPYWLWGLPALCPRTGDALPPTALPAGLLCQRLALMKPQDVWGWGRHTLPSAAAEPSHPASDLAGSSGWMLAVTIRSSCLYPHPSLLLCVEMTVVFSSESWPAF